MDILTPITQALAFAIELAMLGSFIYWGFSFHAWVVKLLAGIGAPVVVILIWGKWLAPMSTTRLHMPWLLIAELSLFILAAVALYFAGRTNLALWMGGLSVLSALLSVITKQF